MLQMQLAVAAGLAHRQSLASVARAAMESIRTIEGAMTPTSPTISYRAVGGIHLHGDVNIAVAQQPGEDSDELVAKVIAAFNGGLRGAR